MINFLNQNSENDSELEIDGIPDYQTKIVLTNKYDIMMRYIKLRKIVISYWDFFTFSFSYCVIFPTMQKLTHKNSNKKIYIFCNIISSLYLSYFFYQKSLKFIVNTFNHEDYVNFRTFCKKYQLEDDFLI
jgi:hypothetical protein